MKMKRCMVLFLLIVLSSGVASAAINDTWNLSDEYTGTVNPDGVWLYGMLDFTYGVPQFLVYENNHTLVSGTGEVVQFWAWLQDIDRDQYGAVNHNTSDHDVASWGFHWKANGINIQSGGYAATYSSVAFVAPETGQYQFDAAFESMTDGKGTTVWFTMPDFSAPWSAALDAYGGANVVAPFNGTVALNAGETVYFSNSPGSTMVDFSCVVTQVPEPLTMSLLAIGGLALVRRRR
ncbi:MAG: hypothetical protein BWY71_00830 [Planctomycetes bacterium ADurb.Bin412]|nr:MAG: hypothetical protein BWY71_00830 [Planctomycetes bacterium ADurb.Bin412]